MSYLNINIFCGNARRAAVAKIVFVLVLVNEVVFVVVVCVVILVRIVVVLSLVLIVFLRIAQILALLLVLLPVRHASVAARNCPGTGALLRESRKPRDCVVCPTPGTTESRDRPRGSIQRNTQRPLENAQQMASFVTAATGPHVLTGRHTRIQTYHTLVLVVGWRSRFFHSSRFGVLYKTQENKSTPCPTRHLCYKKAGHVADIRRAGDPCTGKNKHWRLTAVYFLAYRSKEDAHTST